MSIETVWVATDLYPESSEILIAATEGAVLREMVETIGRSEYEAFVAQLSGDEATDVTYDDAPEAVLRVWSGEREPLDDGREGFFVGSDWLVVQMPVVPDRA